jgi:chitosanase
VLPGDNGHLSFGRSQLSLGSGNLAKLIDAYCKNPGARFGARLSPFLRDLSDRNTSLDSNTKLHNLLRATADDPVMRDTQDSYFDRGFWQQAAQEAARRDIRSALGVATVYDSWVQGAWSLMRDRTVDNHGSVASLGEQAWIAAYLATRRQWLDENPNPILRKTVYRMDALGALARQAQWSLNLPLLVRDQEISVAALAAHPSDCYDGPAPGSRALAVTAPFARGLDVRLLQLGLSDANLDIKADGVFGAGSAESVKQYQRDNDLAVTGVADIALIARLTA